MAVVCTHAHDDHVNQAPALSDRFDAPVYLHPAEAPLWAMAHPDRKPDHDLCDGDVLTAGGIELQVITTPGHSPGSSCLYAPELATVFTGDTLFQGGPGATGRSFSSFDDDHRLDPYAAAHAAGRHHGPDGTRRPDDDRRGGTAPRGVDRARALKSCCSGPPAAVSGGQRSWSEETSRSRVPRDQDQTGRASLQCGPNCEGGRSQ